VKSVFSTVVALAFHMRRKASQISGGVISGKFETGRAVDGAEMSSPKAPRATLLGFPWKPANVYLPRSTMHPWRRIRNGTKVASRMARTWGVSGVHRRDGRLSQGIWRESGVIHSRGQQNLTVVLDRQIFKSLYDFRKEWVGNPGDD
jgi:hypothetical protein